MADTLIVVMSKIKLMKISRLRRQNIKSSTGLCSWSHVHEAGSGLLTSGKHGDSCSPCGPAVSAPTALVAATYLSGPLFGFSHCPNFSLFMGFHGPFSEFLLFSSPDANWPILSTLPPKLLQERGSDGPFLGFMPAHPSDEAEGLGWEVGAGRGRGEKWRHMNWIQELQIISFALR